MESIRWGIIGVGDVTEVKSGPGFQKAERSELVAVMRRNGALARDYAQRHGVPKWYDDATALIHDPAVNAIYIATPPDAHKHYTILAAQAGKPVYVEKPMARNFAECRAMIEACQQAGVPLFVAYYRRALPRFVKVKDLLDSGAIGEPRYITLLLAEPAHPRFQDPANRPWRVIPEQSGGGLLLDVGSHMLDLADFLLGPIREVAGHASNQGRHYAAEDAVSGSFVFDCGVHGVGLWNFDSFSQEDRIELVGTRGKLSFACFAHEPVRLITAAGVEQFEIPHPQHVQQPLIQQVVDALLGLGHCSSTGESGARTNRVMDRLLAHYYRRA